MMRFARIGWLSVPLLVLVTAPALGASVVGFPEYRETGSAANLVVPVSIAPAAAQQCISPKIRNFFCR